MLPQCCVPCLCENPVLIVQKSLYLHAQILRMIRKKVGCCPSEAAAQYRVAEQLAPSATEKTFLSMQSAGCLA